MPLVLRLVRGGTSGIVLTVLLTACGDSAGPTDMRAGTAAEVRAVGGVGDSAEVGSAVPAAPTVKVLDSSGRGVPGIQVTFTVAEGGGSVGQGSALTDAQGLASAGTWTLGASTGENAVVATAAALPSVRFTALAVSPFNVDLEVLGTPTPSELAALRGAVATWRSVIVSRFPAMLLSSPTNTCFRGQPAINQTVSGLLLYVQFTRIDGVGRTLAESGPCYVREGSSLPAMGSLVLDVADLPSLEADGQLQDVVTHEIGHILGFGTIWTDRQLLGGAGTGDPLFLGAGAIAAFLKLGPGGSGVPVENTGGPGTRDAHWRESVFGDELMTGYLDRGANPLSAMTIAAMSDLGYATDPSRAAPYALPPGSGIAGDLVPLDLEPHEVLLSPRHTVSVPGGN